MQSPDRNIDAKLRAVPLPEGLVKRLRQVVLADDDGLDAVLRELPVPAGFVDKMQSIPLADDDGLDAALGDVAVPAGLVQRLQSVSLEDDEGLDEALREVPIPVGLAAPWQRRLSRHNRLVRLVQLAAAASLLFVIAGLYFGSKIAGLVATGNRHDPNVRQPVAPATPTIVENKNHKAAAEQLTRSLAGEETGKPAAPVWRAPTIDIGFTPIEREPFDSNLVDRGPVVPATADPLRNTDIYRWPTVLTYPMLDPLPEPRKAVGLIPRGMDWPMAPGGNQSFLIKHHVHPFVSPAANPLLQSMVVPLHSDSASYELTRRYLEDKELPPPELVRTEEFLAAMDYNFPQPTQQALELSMFAGPSPFARDGLCLLQIGVQARHIADEKRQPIHLVVAVDASAGMRWGGRVAMVRRALAELAGRLAPADRLSLVTFSDDAQVLVQNVGPAEADQFAAAARSISAEGAPNIAAGLGKAYSVAQQEAKANRPAVRVVLLTDSLVDMTPDVARRVTERLTDAAAHGIALHVIELGQQTQADQQLLDLATAGHGAVHRAANAEQLRWALREAISGQSQIVARDARLRVAFNTKTVLEYRLFGHEAKALAGLMPEHPEADFHDGEAATVLYEVRLAPKAAAEIASAELTWYDGGNSPAPNGKQQRLVRRIELNQFATTFNQSAPSLQEAALAAELAEALRKSYFMRAPRTAVALKNVWELTGQVDSRLFQRPGFVDFVAVVQQAMKAKAKSANIVGARRP